MANSPTFVSVILPAHNEELYLAECLGGLINQDYDPNFYEIILVDNNSTDTTMKIAQSFGVRLLSEPIGPVGRVRNSGAKEARGDLLLFIDSDCVPPKSWISYAVKRIGANKSIVLGGGLNLRENPFPIEKYWLLEGKDGATLPKDLLGGCIAIYKDTFLQVGGFDEYITSGEDTKLSESLQQHGFHVIIDRNMSVTHLGNPVTSHNFIRRQVWHSENYLSNIRDSIKDPTFLLILLFSFLITASLITTPISIYFSTISLLIALIVPFIFSIKRITRSRNMAYLKKLPNIYYVDLLYVIGRTVGAYKGLNRILRNRHNV